MEDKSAPLNMEYLKPIEPCLKEIALTVDIAKYRKQIMCELERFGLNFDDIQKANPQYMTFDDFVIMLIKDIASNTLQYAANESEWSWWRQNSMDSWVWLRKFDSELDIVSNEINNYEDIIDFCKYRPNQKNIKEVAKYLSCYHDRHIAQSTYGINTDTWRYYVNNESFFSGRKKVSIYQFEAFISPLNVEGIKCHLGLDHPDALKAHSFSPEWFMHRWNQAWYKKIELSRRRNPIYVFVQQRGLVRIENEWNNRKHSTAWNGWVVWKPVIIYDKNIDFKRYLLLVNEESIQEYENK